jgi:hypothetical protein
MNRITLISAPLITEHTDAGTIERLLRKDPLFSVPHLGILTVAALFKKQGWAVKLSKIDQYYANHIAGGKAVEDFCDDFAAFLARDETGYFGFSSVCSSYYITLMVVERLKALRPDAIIVLGGPQASATAMETMSLSTAVDFILSGEVELSLPDFLTYHLSAPERVPGLSYRRNGFVISNRPASLPEVGTLEMALYDLWEVSSLNSIPVEGGRGCPFKCKFCSTSVYFGRSYRVKDSQTLVANSIDVIGRFGVKTISFVHDNLFVSKYTCEQFCEAWQANESLRGIQWSCSMRAGLIDERIASLLSRSNCGGVFIGIESGSARMQKVINKNLDVEEAVSTIYLLNKYNIHATASFIIGFPEETVDDLGATLRIFGQMLRIPSCKPQVCSFAILAGSEYGNSAFGFDAGSSTISHQGPPLASVYEKYITDNPTLFSAHRRPILQYLDRDFVSETEYFLNYSFSKYRWLVALLSISYYPGIYSVIEHWLKFKREVKEETGDLYNYYSGSNFQRQFMEFAKSLSTLPEFNAEFSSLQQFLCNIYSIEDKYRQELLAIEDNEESTTPLRPDDRVVAACLLVDVEYSFSDAIGIIAAEGQGAFVPKNDSCVVIYIKSRDIMVEEPTYLARKIVRLASAPIRTNELIGQLCSNANQSLPQNLLPKASTAYFYSLQQCLARGLLKKTD